MVSTEYPPMKGGIGRYTSNLVKALRKLGLDVYVVCNEAGKGDFSGLSPTNKQNSEVLLKIVDELNPDIVHIQFEPGMYGSILDPINRANSRTYIDLFYSKCKTPIVTTFHSGYNFIEWMSQSFLIKKSGKIGIPGVPLRFAVKFLSHLLTYDTFKNLNKQKLDQSHSGVVFSNYMSNRIGGGRIIYHGAEPYPQTRPERKEARAKFSLPQDSKLALALGFRTVSKGWDLLKKMNIPYGWKVIVNSSKDHYNTEKYDLNFISNAHSSRRRSNNDNNNNIINLQSDFLEERDFSLLLYACDVILLPYRITSGSGVMFDALAHGIPFIASDLAFFREFAGHGLGIVVSRNPTAFSDGIKKLEINYSYYSQNVDKFKEKLKWNCVASEHKSAYSSIKI
jgi:glycosyltransferase involved in cell wall biosynthesis